VRKPNSLKGKKRVKKTENKSESRSRFEEQDESREEGNKYSMRPHLVMWKGFSQIVKTLEYARKEKIQGESRLNTVNNKEN
jgi:hypothetical protein